MTELPTLASFLDSGSDPALLLGEDLWDLLMSNAEDSSYGVLEPPTEIRYDFYARMLDCYGDDPTAGLMVKWSVECEEDPSLIWRLLPFDHDLDGLAARLSDAGLAPAR